MKILALDGNSILNRAFYATPVLTSKSGEFTNAVYAFLRILGKLTDIERPDGICAAFDLPYPTFRHKKFPGYKAGRRPMPEELARQVPLAKETLRDCGVVVLEREGYEADDILGTVAALATGAGYECAIATGDRDAFQLVSDSVSVLLTKSKGGAPVLEKITPAVIMERYGVTPPGMLEIKALQGDTSDKIPGVPGIGEKTAGELVRRYGDIATIYANLDTLDVRETVREKLRAGRESAFLSRDLGEIRRDVPLGVTPDNIAAAKPDYPELRRLFTRLEFFSILEKLELPPAEEETGGEVFAVCAEPPVAPAAVDLFFTPEGVYAVAEGKICHSSFDESWLLDLISDGNVRKRVNDAKSVYRYAAERGRTAGGVEFCSRLAGYLLDPSSPDYSEERLLAGYHIGTPEVEGGGEEERYAARFSLLCDAMERSVAEAGQEKLLREVEIPLAEVIAEMEETGFLIDSEGISRYGEELQRKIDALESRVYEAVGEPFNLNSPKQLGEALFDKLKLPGGRKTRRGYSTNAEVLESLRGLHPAVEDLLEYRHLSKLKSTYCDSLPEMADGEGRVHSTLNQTETRTGRLSSAEPNLQNIPVRRPEGRELRRYFLASPGYLLCDADYSQIELRVLAHVSGDEAMRAAFLAGEDIHAKTAAGVFGTPESDVTPTMRSRAKAVNFGIVYGIGAFSLAKDLGVSRAEAESYINTYFETYPGVARYMSDVVERAKADGYVSTLFGRRRMLPELRSGNARTRSFGERVARNMPIQGTAADIIKIAMVRVYGRLKREIPAARLLMQVHDELIVEAPESEAQAAARILREEMESAVEFSVPLTVDVHTGRTWYEAKR